MVYSQTKQCTYLHKLINKQRSPSDTETIYSRMPIMQAGILSIGDELALGQTVDTNSAYISAALASCGVSTLLHQTVADDLSPMVDAIHYCSNRVDLLIISGGIGPTADDMTRQALADAMGEQLVIDEESIAEIASFFEKRSRVMPDANRVQAYRPQTASMIPNHCGTAPGLVATLNKATCFVMPGVPSEMKAMYAQAVEPWLDNHAPTETRRVIRTTKINTFGVGESTVAQILGNLMQRDQNPTIGTTVSNGIVSVRIRSEFPTTTEADQQLANAMQHVESHLGTIVFGNNEDTLQQDLVKRLSEKQATVATAESCTGGLIGKLITDIAGSSNVYAGGWVTYSNKMKTAQLGVAENLFIEHGAVSEPVAIAMARGALERSGADLAISITGIAGPGGGSDEKPVGTVWLGLAYRQDATDASIQTQAFRYIIPGDRSMIRDRAAKAALQILRLHLMGESIDLIQMGRPDLKNK